MLPTDLLIDGYNLLHAAGLGRARYGPGDLQRARQALLRKLFEWLTPEEISRTAVVFDARHPPPHLPSHWYIHGLRIVYPRPHGDADVLLEDLIAEHSAPKRLTVVSSDHRLHRAAKTRRATAVDSDEFIDFATGRRRESEILKKVVLPEPQKVDPKADITAAELAYWMTVFQDIKVADLIDPPRPAIVEEASSQAKNSPRAAETSDTMPVQPRRTRTRKKTVSPAADVPKAVNRPELFSAEWIDELQRWVDEQQRRKK